MVYGDMFSYSEKMNENEENSYRSVLCYILVTMLMMLSS